MFFKTIVISLSYLLYPFWSFAVSFSRQKDDWLGKAFFRLGVGGLLILAVSAFLLFCFRELHFVIFICGVILYYWGLYFYVSWLKIIIAMKQLEF